MLNLNDNILAAVDLETTGDRPGYHETIQAAVVPLDSRLQPCPAFASYIRPMHPERADSEAARVHKLPPRILERAPAPDRAADLLLEWFERLNLPIGRTLIPLAHNWPFEAGFLAAWLGPPLMRKIFHFHARDSIALALAINDRAVREGRPVVFPRVSLSALCRQLGITNEKAHDALADAKATAELYRVLLGMLC